MVYYLLEIGIPGLGMDSDIRLVFFGTFQNPFRMSFRLRNNYLVELLHEMRFVTRGQHLLIFFTRVAEPLKEKPDADLGWDSSVESKSDRLLNVSQKTKSAKPFCKRVLCILALQGFWLSSARPCC